MDRQKPENLPTLRSSETIAYMTSTHFMLLYSGNVDTVTHDDEGCDLQLYAAL